MKRTELSSTEKLLEQIRGQDAAVNAAPLPEEAAESPATIWRRRFRSALRLRKPLSIGVDIGYSDLRLVKTIPTGVDRYQILDCRRIPFDPGLDPHHLLFPQFLRRALERFIGASDQASIWTAVSSARLDARLLRIPKVAHRQIPNAVLWAYKKKAPFSDKERLFDFEVLGETTEEESPRLEVLAYTVPREDIDAVKASFLRAGYPLDGVSTYPFLLQNLLRTRWKILGQGHLCALYIGRNWSRIDIFSDGNLLLSRGIRAGLSSMADAIKADPRMNAPEAAPQAPRDIDFSSSPPPEEAARETGAISPAAVLTKLAPGLVPSFLPQDTAATPVDDLEPDDVFEMVKPAIDRLVRQVERTIGHFAINFGDRDIDRLCVSGLICESPRVRTYIADQLGITPLDLNPFENESRTSPPETLQEQLAYIPAVGLASPAEKRTPNFLQSHHDRSRRESRQRFNCVVFALFLLTMLGFVGYNSWQQHELQKRFHHLTQLENELAAASPLLNPETVLVLAAKAKEATDRLLRYSQRYTGMAVVAELSRQTPADIRMTRLGIRLPRDAATGDESPGRTLAIGGIVRGDRLTLEPSLAAYMVQLKASPLLAEPKIIDKSFEMLDGREILRFSAELEIQNP